MILPIDDHARERLMTIAPKGEALVDEGQVAAKGVRAVAVAVHAGEHQAQHRGQLLVYGDPTRHLG